MKIALVTVGLLALLGVAVGWAIGMAANGRYSYGFPRLAGDDPRHRIHDSCRMMGLMFYSSRYGYNERAGDLSDDNQKK